jgi:hypothetical protein
MRRSAGLEAGPADEIGERIVVVPRGRQMRLAAGSLLVCSIVVAFVPSYLLLLLAVAVVVSIASLLTGAPLALPRRLAVAALVTLTGAVVLNLPWLSTFVTSGGWGSIVGPAPPGDRGNSVIKLLTFDLGNVPGSIVSIVLYVSLIAAVMLGRGWRFGWAVRGAALAVTFAWLAVLDDRGALPLRLPEPGIVLVPVAVGLALCAGCVVASFELDVRDGTFGWRQPLALLGIVAVALGLFPGVFALSSGRFETPHTTLIGLLGQLPDASSDGPYRVLWIGDQRVLPVAALPLQPGVGYALTDERRLDVSRVWAPPTEGNPAQIAEALDAMAVGSTTRTGRLLAPWAVRYVVVPIVDGAVSTSANPLPVPAGLLDALSDQLDLAEVYSPPNFVVFENRAWVPTRSMLTAAGAEASRTAGASALAQSDLSGSTAALTNGDQVHPASGTVSAGTFHLAVPFDRAWRLSVDGVAVAPRPAFGASMAFDLTAPRVATLEHHTGVARRVAVSLQLLAWIAVALTASSIRVRPRRLRRRAVRDDLEPVFTMDPLRPDLPDESDQPDEQRDSVVDTAEIPVVSAVAPVDTPHEVDS